MLNQRIFSEMRADGKPFDGRKRADLMARIPDAEILDRFESSPPGRRNAISSVAMFSDY
jgi:hypothetical protein